MRNLREKFSTRNDGAANLCYVQDGFDALVAFSAGLVYFALALVWAFPSASPDLWPELAVGAGVRPPVTIAGGLWRICAQGIFSGFGLDSGLTVLRFLGHVVGAVSVSLVVYLLRSTALRCLQITAPSYLRSRGWFSAAFALGGLLFGCSEPVWRLFQCLGPDALQVFLLLASVSLAIAHLQSGFSALLACAFFIAGVLGFETPMGALSLIAILAFELHARYAGIDPQGLFMNPLATQQMKWRMSFLFLLGAVGVLALDFWLYVAHEGMAAAELEPADLAVQWCRELGKSASSLATSQGCLLGLLTTVAPFVCVWKLMPRATEPESFLPYQVVPFSLLAGGVAFFQLAGFPRMWFWNWTSSADPMITSGVLFAFFMLLAVYPVVWALIIGIVDYRCRDHQYAAIRLLDADLDLATANANRKTARRHLWERRVWFSTHLVLVVALAVSAILSRHKVGERRMLLVTENFLAETLRACGPASCLFTDGVLDAALEFRAACAQRDRPFVCCSLMADRTPYERFINRRAARDEEDRRTFASGPLQVLRLWAGAKRTRMPDVAIQLGREIWKGHEVDAPTALGVVARGGKIPDEEVARARTAAKSLAASVLGFYVGREGKRPDSTNPLLTHVFETIQWRLARLAQMESDELLRRKEGRLAAAVRDLSDKLDKANVSFQKLQALIDRQLQKETELVLTPREGLEIALKRNDFMVARRFALPLLLGEPDDPVANYAMGMSYLVEERWKDSARFFERVLKKYPNDSRVLNNIAVAKWKDGRLDEALEWEQKAQKAAPDSQEVRDNMARIRADALRAKTHPVPSATPQK